MARNQVEAQRPPGDAELIERALQRDESAIRTIIQMHNRKLYRIARSIVGNDHEAEDLLQDSYLKAFSALATFRGESSLGTWLTRIVMNEALQRRRRRADVQLTGNIEFDHMADVITFPLASASAADPERTVAQHQITMLLERAIDQLPDDFRTVLVARTVEGMSIEETSELLGIRPETVKTRLHRARRLLRLALADHLEPMFADAFPFDGKRCGRLTEAVVAKLVSC